jgi:hypothetical protein
LSNQLAQAKQWARTSFSGPAPAKVFKRDDLTG